MVSVVAALALTITTVLVHPAGTPRSVAPRSGVAAHGLGARCPRFGPTLRMLARRADKTVGTAYRPEYGTADPCYRWVATREFGSLTPEIATFPNAIAARPGRFAFDAAERVFRVARARHLCCQLHALVWDPTEHPEWGIVPDWIRALPPERRHRLMVDLVSRTVRRFRGRVSHVTVVNEALDASGRVRPTTWNTTGDARYIADAFRAARRADPKAILLYNDYGAEGLGSKSDAVLRLARWLHRQRVRVRVDGRVRAVPILDGVGLQMHVGLGTDGPSRLDVRANIRRLAAAGLRVRFTEMDVRVPVAAGKVSARDLRRQRYRYRSLVAECLRARSCDGVTFWGFTDDHSWITEHPSSFSGLGGASILDERYRAKPAREGVVAAFRAGRSG